LALVCGFTVFCAPEAAFAAQGGLHPLFLRLSGVVRLAVGVLGCVLAVRAFRARRLDHAVGPVRPVLGGLASAFHAFAGFALFTIPTLFSLPTGETAWAYESPEFGFRLTLPSAEWREAKMKDGTLSFSHKVHRMHAAVRDVTAAPKEQDFHAAVKRMNASFGGAANRVSRPTIRQGLNSHGHAYWFATFLDVDEAGQTVFVATAVCWREEARQIVHIIFEAKPRTVSEMGRASEMRLFENAAETICLSVE
jgi:hypothetical protein